MQDYSAQPLKTFQLDKLTIKEKSDWNYGKRLAQYMILLYVVESQVIFGLEMLVGERIAAMQMVAFQ